jgi:periplasmic divalent cation tolerance protein
VPTDYCIAMTTLADEEGAVALAREVVAARLAACVQMQAIRSVFTWEGKVEDAPEVLVLMKTRADRYAALQAFVAERHPYDVPEILQVPVDAGFGPYLSWIDDATTA